MHPVFQHTVSAVSWERLGNRTEAIRYFWPKERGGKGNSKLTLGKAEGAKQFLSLIYTKKIRFYSVSSTETHNQCVVK